jgi:hypothetical protein
MKVRNLLAQVEDNREAIPSSEARRKVEGIVSEYFDDLLFKDPNYELQPYQIAYLLNKCYLVGALNADDPTHY